MATEELKKEVQTTDQELQTRQKIENPSSVLQESLGGLEKYGGFQLLKGMLKGVENMDSNRKAVKNIFLKDSAYAASRKKLKKELELWIDTLEKGGADSEEIIDTCKNNCQKAEQNLSTNLLNVHDAIKQLEITYRTLDSFFSNAGQGKIDCLSLMNVNKEQLKDLNSDDTKAVQKELNDKYDRLFLKDNYSLLVAPGYLGDATNIREWAKTAYNYKVIMVTDFMDVPEFDMLMEALDNANLQDQDGYLGNIIMTCNYILGRKKSEEANEEDDMYIPGSGALAGRMANTEEIVIAQGASGKKFGTLSNVKGSRIDLHTAEIKALINKGVIPMVEEEGRTMAFSDRTLYNGGTIGLQEYPIVRVFDWIGKVFQRFFNEQYGKNWDSKVKNNLEQNVKDFLNDYSGSGKLIKGYSLDKLDQDPKTKDIHVEVKLEPIFAAQNFLIKFKGKEGGWELEVE